MQELTVAKCCRFRGLSREKETAGEKDTVLLPGKQVPEGTKKGDKLSVFIYKDSQDRLIATTREPKLIFRRDSSASGSPGEQNRCISGLGIGKRFVSSI